MANYTEHYQLHQWEPDDAFLRTDFNEDFKKIDNALSILSIDHIIIGSYRGDGTSSRTISLPWTPTILLISGEKQVSSYTRGLLTIVFGNYSHQFMAEGHIPSGNITIVENGFTVLGDYHNDLDIQQNYLAIR